MTRGFTLLELIIATMIFVIVLGAAYALFDSSHEISRQAEFRASLLQEARTALRTIREDLQGAYGSASLYDTGLIGSQGGSDAQPLYKLDLVSVNNRTRSAGAGEIDVTRTAYSIDEESSTEQKGLVRRKTKQLLHLTTVQREDEGLEEVAPNVVYVKFRYYDAGWTEVWDSTRSGKLPTAIEVTVHVKGIFKDREVIEKFTDKIYLPMAAETPAKTP